MSKEPLIMYSTPGHGTTKTVTTPPLAPIVTFDDTTETWDEPAILPPPTPSKAPLVKPVPERVWNLPSTVELAPKAADFYLLYELSLDGLDEGRFATYLLDWAPILRAYTDMVVGGELRHIHGTGGRRVWSIKQTPLHEALNDEEAMLVHDRHTAWERWAEFRRVYGADALDWATKIYRVWRDGGYGGKSWAAIAEMLWLFETSKLTETAFVDICWGLQHNTGTYFNKMAWNAKPLGYVLNANLKGDVDTVADYASTDVASLYKKVYNKEVA